MGQAMANLKLDYVDEYRDRSGKLRRYFRKGGKRFGALPGAVGSEEFMAAYAAYLAEKPSAAKDNSVHADLLAKLIIDFYGSRNVYRSQAIDPPALPVCARSSLEGTWPQVGVDHDGGKRRKNYQQDR